MGIKKILKRASASKLAVKRIIKGTKIARKELKELRHILRALQFETYSHTVSRTFGRLFRRRNYISLVNAVSERNITLTEWGDVNE